MGVAGGQGAGALKDFLYDMETWKESKIVFNGKILRLRAGGVVLDDGVRAYREVVEHPGGACVLPFTGDAFVLVRQYRIALARYVLEAPAGKLEPGETPEACAIKELHEETGYREDRMVSLGSVYPSVGFCNEVIHLFLALDLTEVGRALEPEERIEPVLLPITEVRKKLADGTIKDGKTAIILQRALDFLGIA